MAYQILSVVLLVLGFGFVIFFHELGHFLAAKWVGIKVEQFAVGFGQALFSWRKGMGFHWGSTNKRYEEILAAEREGKNDIDPNTISETEYRLNWIPLGGYVKMLGQDDLNPNSQVDDPRAYNRKSIGARMVVVSAGVIMNIILAAIGFMVVFMVGFNAPPTVVGGVLPQSPAQKAGLQVGDRILTFDGTYQHDFTKITLNPALVEEGESVPMTVDRDGQKIDLTITPERFGGDPKAFLGLGIEAPRELRGVKKTELPVEEFDKKDLYAAETLAIRPGETIVAVNGTAVGVKDIDVLDAAIQASGGEPIALTVRGDETGAQRQVSVQPRFMGSFSATPMNFAGMVPRPSIRQVTPESPARGKLLPGDAIVAISTSNGGQKSNPSTDEMIDELNKAGQADQPVDFKVLRDGAAEPLAIEGIVPSIKVDRDRYGVGMSLGYDEAHAVVAGVTDNSPAAAAGIPKGAEITSINGKPVDSWYDVQRELASAVPDSEVKLTAKDMDGESKDYTFKLTADQHVSIAANRYTHGLLLHEMVEPRKAPNPLVAASWGVTETRDFILQFYLTLQRMFQGSVSYTNMMGPVGIFHAGTKFAFKGADWLIWFLAMISANLAVVNFLPIPIVDGGLFTFLIIEKIQGKPISARTQAIAQVVGLAVILSVFLLVTYQDIARFL